MTDRINMRVCGKGCLHSISETIEQIIIFLILPLYREEKKEKEK